MTLQLQISFRNMEPSPAIEAKLRKQAEHLGRLFDRITACRVVIAAPHRHQRRGKLYDVSIDLSVPGRKLAVSHARPRDQAHEDIDIAIRDAFEAAGRLLQDHARRARGDVKSLRTRRPEAQP
jgi:ribosome-associated translation inhibitor RaiA